MTRALVGCESRRRGRIIIIVHIDGLRRRNSYCRRKQHKINMLLRVSYNVLLIEVY